MKEAIAFDRSVRSFDPDGRLHVAVTNISKAMVCPYLGSEIPDYKELGLDAGQVYQLLRDPDELKRAAPTFKNLPLLIQHVPVNAESPRRDLIVGTTGSDVEFCAPYLQCSLAAWDAAAIAGIESKEQVELSSAYRYRADMTPGEYEGVAYDGIMRDIIGNHVALVDVGRAGHDVVVADRNPFQGFDMKRKEKIDKAKADIVAALEKGGVAIAQDAASLEELDKVIDTLIGIEEAPGAPAMDEDDENNDEFWEDDPDNPGKRRKKTVAQDEGGEQEGKEEDKKAMDKAIKVACDETEKRVIARMEALHTAREEVAPLVGKVALDSATAVYKFALDHAKVDIEGVHPSAYRSLVKMHLGQRASKPKFAEDAAIAKQVLAQFPNLNRFTKA